MTAVSGWREHSLALGADGSVWACGSNQDGQLGDGTNVNQLTPVNVVGLSGVVAISAGGYFGLAGFQVTAFGRISSDR